MHSRERSEGPILLPARRSDQVRPVQRMGPVLRRSLPGRCNVGPEHSPVSISFCMEGLQTTASRFSEERKTRQAAGEIARSATRVAPSTLARSTAIPARRRLIDRLKRITTKHIHANKRDELAKPSETLNYLASAFYPIVYATF